MTDQDTRSIRHAAHVAEQEKKRFLFVLLPDFAAADVALATEALSEANAGGSQFSWRVLTETGAPVASRSGLGMAVDGGLEPVSRHDTILLCGAPRLAAPASVTLLGWLRRAASHGGTIGAIGGASGVLAQAGLTGDAPVAAHWATASAMRECFPDTDVAETVFHLAPRRMTCAGGMATLDMMLALIAKADGSSRAHETAATLACAHLRASDSGQVVSTSCRHARRHPALLKAIAAMEASLDAPRPANDIARDVGVSCRQLERLFSTHLGQPPKRFHDGLRLDRGRQLMQQTDLSIAEISAACGFNSSRHFSKHYHRRFGVLPSVDRGVP